MSEVRASDLLAVFELDSEAGVQAKNALRAGADAEVWSRHVPASTLRGILQRRLSTLQRRGKPVVGAEECLASLAERGEQGLRVAYVDDRQRAGRYFRLYLDPHPLKVIGCIGVDIVSPEDDPVGESI